MSLKKQKYELKEYLNALCITQREAALSIGCSERHIRRLINGEAPAGFRLRRLISKWAGDKIDIAKLAMIDGKGK